MSLHNFIKIHLGIKEDIYYIPINILNDIKVNNSGGILQSSFTQINII